MPEGAETFDLPEVWLPHREGHATFRTMIEEYQFTDPILARIAQMRDEFGRRWRGVAGRAGSHGAGAPWQGQAGAKASATALGNKGRIRP